MNLQHLRYALEVEKTGSISRAAQNLYMGQPNLSKALKELENEIGITIFNRTAKGVETTETGEQFLAYAGTILSQIDELESLYKPNQRNEFQFRISVPRATYISAAFADFLNQLPRGRPLNVHFKETSSMGAINDVATGEAQFGIVRYPSAYEPYFLNHLKSLSMTWELLWEFRMCLVMSEDHPLADAREIPYHLLDGYTEIAHGDDQIPSLNPAQFGQHEKMKGSKRKICIYERGSQYNLLTRLKGSYMWVSPIPFSILKENRLVMKECSSLMTPTRDIIVRRKNHLSTEEERAFLDMVRKIMEESVV